MSPKLYFENIDYYFTRGRGIAVFNCSSNVASSFLENLKNRDYKGVRIDVSSLISSQNVSEIQFDKCDYCFVYQDKNNSELSKIIEFLINKFIFPFFFRGKPIFYFSVLDKSEYIINIQSGLIHTNYNFVVQQLLIEQLDRIIDQVCFNFSSPEFLTQNRTQYLYTPIEKIMSDELMRSNLEFTPQVKLGRFQVDFLVEIGQNKIIVECDGLDYHNPYKDKERDKELNRYGYKIFHFTGSEIYRDIKNCIDIIKNYSSEQSSPKFNIDSDLDDSQKKALNHISGPIRVLAPAGSGKTKTLINRIANLINEGVNPNKILALAFNKRAAEEMKKRLSDKRISVAEKLSDEGVVVKTFHSFGYEIIQEELGWKFNGQTENNETRRLLKSAISNYYELQSRRNKDPLDIFLDALRRTKMELPHIDEVVVEDNGVFIPFKNILNEYQRLQTKSNFFNFDDMIYLALRLILKNNILRRALQNKFEYILIDEFQDLNKAQILLMQILALPQNNLFIVGDDDQMIYGWRGAEIYHILKFNERYAESEDCTLSTNYRSNKRIVNHSKWLIDHNLERVKKNIHPRPEKPAGKFDIKLSESMWHQAYDIVKWILELKENERYNWQDFAVLFRYNTFQFILAMLLDGHKIPHTPVDNRRLFQKSVGKDIFSYLRIILFPLEATSDDYSRILKRPNRSLSNEVINHITGWEFFINSPSMNGLQQWQINKLLDVVKKIQLIQNHLTSLRNKPSSILSMLSEEFSLKEFYQDQTKKNIELDEAAEDILLEVIINIAKEFQDIESFYGHIYHSIFDEINDAVITEDGNSNKVVLSTIHKTKGNEFINVAYFNLMKNEHLSEQSDIEEERRVTYVGITRAIKNIIITAPNNVEYSNFLKELAFNPEFNNISDINLSNELAKSHRKMYLLKEKKLQLESKINSILKKYPELQGSDYMVQTKIFRNVRLWLRQKFIDSATKNIENLEQRIRCLIEDEYFPIKDKIEKIEIELKFRSTLSD